MKKIFFIIIIIFVLLFLFIQKYILGVSLIWKTYKNPNVPFTFKYPSNWYLCEELYPNIKQNSIHISDQPIDCKRIFFKKNSRSLSISNSGETTTESNIKIFLEKMELEQKIRKERGEPPIVPGFIWRFQSYRNDLLTLKNSSTAKISGLPSPFLEYATLYKGEIYLFSLSEIDTIKSLPLRIILWTFKVTN
jgi:hypothetical protein